MNTPYAKIIEILTAYEASSVVAELNLKWEVGKEFDKEVKDGRYAGKPSKVAMDISKHIHKFTHHEYGVQWFTRCHQLYVRLSDKDMAVIKRHLVPMAYVNYLVFDCTEERRDSIIKSIIKGTKTKFRVPKRGWTQNDEHCSDITETLVQFPVPMAEDRWRNAFAALFRRAQLDTNYCVTDMEQWIQDARLQAGVRQNEFAKSYQGVETSGG